MEPRNRLTAKELQVAGLVWEGRTNRDIAQALGTTEQVVKNYLRNTFDKLGVWSRLELALYVASHGEVNWSQKTDALHPPESAAMARRPDQEKNRAAIWPTGRSLGDERHREAVDPDLRRSPA